MLQELLHNVVKHAQAAHALVELVEHERAGIRLSWMTMGLA
jgi:signal transduction histidine kinase